MRNIEYYIVDVFGSSNASPSGNEAAVFLLKDDLKKERDAILKTSKFSKNVFILGGNEETGFNVEYVSSENKLWIPRSVLLSAALTVKKNFVDTSVKNVLLNLEGKSYKVSISTDNTSSSYLVSARIEEHLIAVSKRITKKFGSSIVSLPSSCFSKELYPEIRSFHGDIIVLLPLVSYDVLQKVDVNKVLISELEGIKKKPLALICYTYVKGKYHELTVKTRVFLHDERKVRETLDVGEPHVAVLSSLVDSFQKDMDINIFHGIGTKFPVFIEMSCKKDQNDGLITLGGKVNLISIGNWSA